jgi:hypothetical protein
MFQAARLAPTDASPSIDGRRLINDAFERDPSMGRSITAKGRKLPLTVVRPTRSLVMIQRSAHTESSGREGTRSDIAHGEVHDLQGCGDAIFTIFGIVYFN